MTTLGRQYIDLAPGDPAPWFQAASTSNPAHSFESTAGRYVVLCFFGSAADPVSNAALNAVTMRRALFDDHKICLFGVSVDPSDRDTQRVSASLPGIRFFWDFDGAVSRAYGALPVDATSPIGAPFRRFWLVVDPTLRVMRAFAIEPTITDHTAVLDYLQTLPAPDRHTGSVLQAPILLLPNVFEPELCRRLIELYQANGGSESGYMRQYDGKTVFEADARYKHRRDYYLTDTSLIEAIQVRVRRRLAPEIHKVHQFQVTHMERYLVCCYSAEEGSHFAAHRDNTTTGTAHRRFAVSINLNSDFDGGDLSFPEYGGQGFKPPEGAAVVFSCSLLHQVSKMTRGKRYAFLPFLYDEAAARIREQNQQFVDWDSGKA
jgi:peroxiredoxin/predicted 2-oxoglutarate/Fe(II)-dependent dioxygenase YbiX